MQIAVIAPRAILSPPLSVAAAAIRNVIASAGSFRFVRRSSALRVRHANVRSFADLSARRGNAGDSATAGGSSAENRPHPGREDAPPPDADCRRTI